MKHYTKEDLELYRHHQLSILGRIACAAHLKECPACTKLLGELEHELAIFKICCTLNMDCNSLLSVLF